jgi:hypothetical protein
MRLELESGGMSFGYEINDFSGKTVFKLGGSPFILGSDVTFQVYLKEKLTLRNTRRL